MKQKDHLNDPKVTQIAKIWPKSGRGVEEKNPLPRSKLPINTGILSDLVEVEEKSAIFFLIVHGIIALPLVPLS